MPTFSDFLNYGPGAWNAEKNRKNKAAWEQRVKELLEQALDAREPKNFSDDPAHVGPVMPAHTPELTPSQEVDLAKGLNITGINPHTFFNKGKLEGDSRVAQAQAQAIERALPQINDPGQLTDLALGKSIAPGAMAGGIGYNKYSGEVGYESPAVTALADKYKAQTQEVDQRVNEVDRLLGQVSDPRFRANVANQRSVTNLTTKKFKTADGRLIEGMVSFDASGKPVVVPVTNDASGNAYTAVPSSSTRQFRQTKHPDTIWQEAYTQARNELTKGKYKFSRSGPPEDEVKTLADTIFAGKMRQEAPDSLGGIEDEPAAQYGSADEVKAAYKAGRMSREEAMRILQEEFGFQ